MAQHTQHISIEWNWTSVNSIPATTTTMTKTTTMNLNQNEPNRMKWNEMLDVYMPFEWLATWIQCAYLCCAFSVFLPAFNFGPLFPQVKCILGLIIIADYFFFQFGVLVWRNCENICVCFLCVAVVTVAVAASGSLFLLYMLNVYMLIVNCCTINCVNHLNWIKVAHLLYCITF